MRSQPLILLGSLLALAAGRAAGDVVHLRSGGRVEGAIVSRTATELVVRTAAGKVTLKAADVARIEVKATPLDVYRETAAKVKEDDADGRYKLGLWCQDQKLFREARQEFEKAIALDPNHKGARARLGYVQRDGTWLTEAEAKKADGLVRVGDKWVSEQERLRGEQREVIAAWVRRVRQLIAARPVTEQAVAERLAEAIGDRPRDLPNAALRYVLEEMIKEAIEAPRDRTNDVRLALVGLLADQRGDETADLLRKTALRDIDGRVRAAATKALAAQRDVENAAYFVGLLHRFTSSRVRLGSDKAGRATARRVLRRASEALAGLGDARAVPALVNALTVRFQIKEKDDELPPLNINLSTNSLADMAIVTDAMGNQIAVPITDSTNWGLDPNLERDTEDPFFFNEAAYNTLRTLTGQDFAHDKRAWLAWWYRNRHNLEE
ncbi:MAG TPA: hypothetical protein VNE39_08910 [Planctomycetota bacterium]|nr:hypothetical protein [Planctomycetota bacterium]